MMKKFIFVMVACLLPAVAAQAAETVPELDAESCRILSEYRAPADVSADAPPPAAAKAGVTPGSGPVDAQGKPVVEADLNKSPVVLPENMEFEYTIDTAKYTGIKMSEGSEGIMNIGTIRLNKDGSMTFNGEPMDGQQEAALRALCAEKGHEIKAPAKKVELINQKDDLLKQ